MDCSLPIRREVTYNGIRGAGGRPEKCAGNWEREEEADSNFFSVPKLNISSHTHRSLMIFYLSGTIQGAVLLLMNTVSCLAHALIRPTAIALPRRTNQRCCSFSYHSFPRFLSTVQ